MKRFLSIFLATAAVGLAAVPAEATLIDRGNGFIYDSDLNITWLDVNPKTGLTDARRDAIIAAVGSVAGHALTGNDFFEVAWGNPTYTGRMTWWGAMAWADQLVYGGYSDWRLPKVQDGGIPGCDGFRYSGSDCGYNVRTGELGHLFYDELGNQAQFAPDGTKQSSFGLVNKGQFATLTDINAYWYGKEYAPYPADFAWDFFFGNGTQEAIHDSNHVNSIAVRDGDVLGGTSSDPVMPGANGNFSFGVGRGQQVFIDPIVTVGYDYLVSSGPNMRSVLLPNIGDGLFDLYLYNTSLGDYVFDRVLTQGVSYDFGGSGIDRFRIRGIETGAGLDPNDPAAFITGLTFASNGIVDMSMTPLTFDTGSQASVPEPGTMMLMGSGLAGLALWRKRFSIKQGSAGICA